MKHVGFGSVGAAVAAVGLLCAACGDDDGGQDTDGGTSGSTAGTTTTATTTTSSTTADTTTSTTTAGSSTTDPSGTGTSGDTDETTGGGPDCDALPEAPLSASPVFDAFMFDGSEDLTFDGAGNVVAYVDTNGPGGEVVAVSADGQSMDTIATGVPAIYGLRYLDNGLLVAASYTDGRVIELSTGVVVDYVTDIDGINGVQPDFEGRVWATNFSQVLLIDDTPMATPVVDPAPSANGIVYDPDRARIFFTDYGDGTVNQADVDKMGNVGTATMLVDLGATTSPDGMALDECGNLYVVDQGGNMIYRVFLDADANVVGLPEELLADTTPTNIANAQFGVGAGFDATTLYAIGTPGVLYAVEVGVAGAPVPVP